MAFELKQCVIQNGCEGFYFIEKTGAYDVSLNPTGWGVPNPLINQVSIATLSVLYAGATVPVVIDVLGPLPTTNVDGYYEVTAAALGLTEMPAGITRVTYSITLVADTYTSTSLVLFDCEFDCCVAEKMIEAAQSVVNGDCCNDCTNDKVWNALFAEAVLEGARAATCSGLVDAANTDIEYLETKCGESPCSGC